MLIPFLSGSGSAGLLCSLPAAPCLLLLNWSPFDESKCGTTKPPVCCLQQLPHVLYSGKDVKSMIVKKCSFGGVFMFWDTKLQSVCWLVHQQQLLDRLLWNRVQTSLGLPCFFFCIATMSLLVGLPWNWVYTLLVPKWIKINELFVYYDSCALLLQGMMSNNIS